MFRVKIARNGVSEVVLGSVDVAWLRPNMTGPKWDEAGRGRGEMAKEEVIGKVA